MSAYTHTITFTCHHSNSVVIHTENAKHQLASLCAHHTITSTLPSGEAGPELKMEFLKEISTMKKISMGRCPHVVNMIGCCTLQEPLALVLEYAAYGDLLEYLRTIRKRVSALL